MLFDDDADFDDDFDDDRFSLLRRKKLGQAPPPEVGPVREILLVREVRVDRNRRSGEEQRLKRLGKEEEETRRTNDDDAVVVSQREKDASKPVGRADPLPPFGKQLRVVRRKRRRGRGRGRRTGGEI